MKRPIPTCLLTACLAVALPGPDAAAGPYCADRDDIVRQLEQKYGETRRSLGVSSGKGVFEIYVLDETGSWTIILTNPRGRSCLMAAGEHWEAVEPEPAKAPA